MDAKKYLEHCRAEAKEADQAAMAAWFRGEDTNDDWMATKLAAENLRVAIQEADEPS